jgi:NDP-sugar pyrophosphorylase family protein
MSTLERILEKLKKAGILKIVMYCDDESKQLKKVLTNKKYMKFDVKFVKNKFQGTASALYECKPYLSPEPFLLMYGDIIADIDLFDLQEFHKSHAGIATMVITSVADPLPWGIVRVKRNLITQFFEKGTPESNRDMRLTNLINAGIYIFNPDIFSFLTSQTKSLEADVFPKLIEGRKLYSYLLDGMWFNIGRGNMLEMAKKHCTLDT